MGLERRDSGFDFRQKQICGGCLNVVNNVSIQVGSVVMVKQNSETHKVTGWGGGEFHEKISIPFNQTYPKTDENGVVHYVIPVAVEQMSVAGNISGITAYADSVGHELALLP